MIHTVKDFGMVSKAEVDAEDEGSNPGLERSPREGKWQPPALVLPGESHERSLVGTVRGGHKESDVA